MSADAGTGVDQARFNKFHLRVAAMTTGGLFCDGYIIGTIGVALVLSSSQLGLGATWDGLIGASALIGIFFGSLFFGWLSDRIGRKNVYTYSLVFFVVGSALQFFVTTPSQLFVLRLAMGLAMGADYAIGAPLLSEFAPRKSRGPLLSSLNGLWTIGFVVAYVASASFVRVLGAGGTTWRWILVSSAVPALIVLVMRIGTPESPRWLLRKGRVREARWVTHRYLGCDIDDLADLDASTTSYKILFKRGYRKRLAFASIFWMCQAAPWFALYTFLPTLLRGLGIGGNSFTGELAFNLLQLVGAIVGIAVMNMFRRRPFVIWSFGIMCASMLALGIWSDGPMPVILIAFTVYTFVMAVAGNLQTVYPAEVFPTDVRASGVGIAAATSRVGSAISTFLLPVGLATFGLHATVISAAALLAVGLGVSLAWAPETRDLTLDAASQGDHHEDAGSELGDIGILGETSPSTEPPDPATR